MGWGLQPLALAKAHLESGRLVELAPKHRVNVNLNWVTPRLKSELLDKLTRNLKVQCLQSQYLERE
jgi:LysR family transcriptional regulator (chromosome initiation inhibitor)